MEFKNIKIKMFSLNKPENDTIRMFKMLKLLLLNINGI